MFAGIFAGMVTGIFTKNHTKYSGSNHTKKQIIIDLDDLDNLADTALNNKLQEKYVRPLPINSVAGNKCKYYIKKWRIPPIGIFILICAVLLAFAVPIILLLGRARGFDTQFHKYKHLPATICLGGANITNIWYSPPYPFNTTATYAPAMATYQTWAFTGDNNSLIPVLGKIPNKLEELGLVDMPCGYCSNRINYICSFRSCGCRCKYMLGELQIAIQKLLSVSNYTCVIGTETGTNINTNEIISLVPSYNMLNQMYRDQITAFVLLGVCGTFVLSVLGWVTYKLITLFALSP